MVSKLEERFDLSSMTVGILGMAFKEESDDIRSSLSYKLKRILKFKALDVLCHDPYVREDSKLVDLETVLAKSDLLILAAPHDCYLELSYDVPLIDVWGKTGGDTRV
jgi:UDP-N-acetyl-D-mannosaminuronic acid dehydrogenase